MGNIDMTDLDHKGSSNGIASILEGLISWKIDSGKSAAEAVYKQIEDTPAVLGAVASLKKADFEAFHMVLKEPYEQFEELLIGKHLGADPRLVFVFQQSQFISVHLQNLFEQIEGRAYSVDKEGCVLALYVRWLLTGKEIEFDTSAAYTFMFPKKILTQHQLIVNFIDSIYHLYWGKPDKYIAQLADLYTKKL
jgi:hypothetical protein